MREIDVRGLSCPEPVLIVMDEMDVASGEELVILSDAAHTRDNLLKLAKEYGREGKSEMRGRDFAITIR